MSRNKHKNKNRGPRPPQVNWSNQTEIGKRFGLSAVKVGNILVENGLKDPETRAATKKALSEGWAKSTPLKDGTPFWMWDSGRVKDLIGQDHQKIRSVEFYANEVRAILREAEELSEEGQDKLGWMMADYAYDEVPKDIRAEVKALVESTSPLPTREPKCPECGKRAKFIVEGARVTCTACGVILEGK
jgi:hypothetical protein